MVDEKDEIRLRRPRKFLVKDYDAFINAQRQYARAFYSPEKLADFSETGVAGMFIGLSSYVADNLSYYLDHQFAELDRESAVETQNIERLLRDAGVPIRGATPAVVDVTFAIEVDAEKVGTVYLPREDALPVIQAGTIVESNSGIRFELQEDLDFTEKDGGEFVAETVVSATSSTGVPTKFIMTLTGLAVSGFKTSETFTIGNTFVPFRTLTLSNENVNQIERVQDADGNRYYEVDALTQDTVFTRVSNVTRDSDRVADNLELRPAPYRYTTDTSLSNRTTTLRFGAGEASDYDIDNVPDPSRLALPLYGKKTLTRFTIDPNRLLKTSTLGIAPINTTLTVEYSYGGGLSHNIEPNTLRNVVTLNVKFPGVPAASVSSRVRASISVTNRKRASGGDSAPTVDELRQLIPAFRNAQSRVVTTEDLLARVYTIPTNFGSVFRAGVRSSENDPNTSQLHIISRDSNGRLVPAPDTLKLNLRKYLNPFRVVPDAIDILDVAVVNIGVRYEIVVEPGTNKQLVIQDINKKLVKYLDVRRRQVDQPLSLGDLRNIIYNNTGVTTVTRLRVVNLTGSVQGKQYSGVQHDVDANTYKEHVFPPHGGMFEVKFPNVDIVGSIV